MSFLESTLTLMLGHFPSPYPDETFYSICSRYSNRVKYFCAKELCKELFGNQNATAVNDLPCYLNNFAAALPENDCFTPQRIVSELTLLTYYSPFLSPEILESTKNQMLTSHGAGVHSRAGLMATKVKIPKFLRYCFLCTKEDFTKFGEVYWHRSHQLPGVFVCWKHKSTLNESYVRTVGANNPQRFIALREINVVPDNEKFNKNYKDVLWKISLMSHTLLFANFAPLGKEILTDRYKDLLITRELATYTKSLRVSRLLEEFSDFYPLEILNLLGCEFKGRSIKDDNWLLRLLRKPKSVQHPLYHILLINFLNLDIYEFFEFSNLFTHFGKAPWICLNPAANHYKQDIIKEFRLGKRSRSGKPVGIFKCVCGFEFIRSGPDTKPEDKFRIDKMINFGKVWELKLVELWNNESIHITKIAEYLNVDPLTVKKYARKLNLSFEKGNKIYKELAEGNWLNREQNNSTFESLLNENRIEWLNLLKSLPDSKLKELRFSKPRLYSWLYQYDSIWLKQNLPQNVQVRKTVNQYVDWKSRDLEVKSLIENAAQAMLSSEERPKQITKTALGKKAECLPFLLIKLDKLPHTKAALGFLIETKENYAVRKVRWVAKNFRRSPSSITKSRLINSACVYKMRENTEVKKAIDEELNLSEKKLLK